MTMKVRDELQGGLPFTPTRLRWATEAVIPRTAPIGWSRAWSATETQRSPDQKPWAIDADGEAWWPVEVVAVAPVYTVKANGRTVVTTVHLPRLFAYVHDLRNAGGPVTVEQDGREMTAVEVEELMLSCRDSVSSY